MYAVQSINTGTGLHFGCLSLNAWTGMYFCCLCLHFSILQCIVFDITPSHEVKLLTFLFQSKSTILLQDKTKHSSDYT